MGFTIICNNDLYLKSLFEEIYLNNQDIYLILESKIFRLEAADLDALTIYTLKVFINRDI
ncbi:Uncharacterised protein [Mycoplasmopsis bovirhinis]|uniref:Uncharacterized protein n=1 Tax=Mycoplasmopsis bovirhinis TaxID=29553 RepID=A0A449AF36_9BACT|nr:Uncharacterised protein [Mycoplasmopsis bovirhinis]